MKKFSVQVAEAIGRIDKRTDAVVRDVTLRIGTAVILGTPVDIGRARGNWQTTVNTPAGGETARTDKGGSAAIAELSERMGGAGTVTYLTNNLPYIEMLEYGGYPNPPKKPTGKTVDGFSKQAPTGMVRVALARIPEFVTQAISEDAE